MHSIQRFIRLSFLRPSEQNVFGFDIRHSYTAFFHEKSQTQFHQSRFFFVLTVVVAIMVPSLRSSSKASQVPTDLRRTLGGIIFNIQFLFGWKTLGVGGGGGGFLNTLCNFGGFRFFLIFLPTVFFFY